MISFCRLHPREASMNPLSSEIIQKIKDSQSYYEVIATLDVKAWNYYECNSAVKCYLLHYKYAEVKEYYLSFEGFNPLLTLVSDAITTGNSGSILRTMAVCDNDDSTDLRHHLQWLCVAGYGVFVDGDIDMAQRSSVLDYVLQHDAAHILRLFLTLSPLRTHVTSLGMVLRMRAAKYGASQCCRLVAPLAGDNRYMLQHGDPLLAFRSALLHTPIICSLTAHNALLTLAWIMKRFPNTQLTAQLDQNTTRTLAQLTDHRQHITCEASDHLLSSAFDSLAANIALSRESVSATMSQSRESVSATMSQSRESVSATMSPSRESANIELFAKVTALSCDLLVAANCPRTRNVCHHESVIDVLCKTMRAMYSRTFQSSTVQIHEQFCCMLLNKIVKALFQYDPNVVAFHKILSYGIWPCAGNFPQFGPAVEELLRLCFAHGFRSMGLVRQVKEAYKALAHEAVPDAMHVIASLLPNKTRARCRDVAWECWRKRVRSLRKSNSDQERQELPARDARVHKRLHLTWGARVPSLSELCRATLYQTWRGRIPGLLIDDAQIPHPVRDFLSLNTCTLQYDWISRRASGISSYLNQPM